MSHPKAPAASRSTYYQLPAQPMSPPYTDSELGPAPSNGQVDGPGVDFDPVALPLHSETSMAKSKRVSTLAYTNSGMREPRERSIQRSSKSLVVVIPPEHFSRAHGQLGHTLSSGPHNRLSNGILMPLFPTMYGQLTAIAREFNLPSVAGLCLYLHFSEGGSNFMPRISDETWQVLWGSLLDGSTPSGLNGLPVSGRIEFDIDLNKARWYNSWIGSSVRESVEPTAPPFQQQATHWRDGSRASIGDEEVDIEQRINTSATRQTPVPLPIARNVPRKLSLVGRYEPSSTQPPKSISQMEGTGIAIFEVQRPITALSPISQNVEPPSAKELDLTNRVNSWRQSALFVPKSLTLTTDLALESEPLAPRTVSVDGTNVIPDPVEDHISELNLDDFIWTPSSAGPPSYEGDTPLSSARLPSIHLDRRIEGSVCMTPSICTSFGPFDYDLHSPLTDVSYVRTPDIGCRMLQDCPPTPSTATTWGAPLSYPPSPASACSKTPSIHLGLRGEFSKPVTPASATSWGAPSWPASPAISEYAPSSVDLGDRMKSSAPVTPTHAAFGWPYYDTYKNMAWGHVWPYYDMHKSMTWNHVWPYFMNEIRQSSGSLVAEHEEAQLSTYPTNAHPCLVIYPSVYPYIDMYPAASVSREEPRQAKVYLSTAYPAFDIYPAAYPHFDIYPQVAGVSESVQKDPTSKLSRCASVKLAGQYPNFVLYPDVYPYVSPYPHEQGVSAACCVDTAQSEEAVIVILEAFYPSFNIYPAYYPYFDIYPDFPPHEVPCTESSKINARDAAYPYLDIYPLVYPAFDIYPALSHPALPPREECAGPMNTSIGHPLLNLYPALYPYSGIYPVSPCAMSLPQVSEPIPMAVTCSYPYINLYPAVYPMFDIYPKLLSSESHILSLRKIGALVTVKSVYPFLSIYTAVYPYIEIYPTLGPLLDEILPSKDVANVPSVALETSYPYFNIYPAVYPALEVYPKTNGVLLTESVESPQVSNVNVGLSYPHLCIYATVYPHFDIYPGPTASNFLLNVDKPVESRSKAPPFGSVYPTLIIYRAVYPFFDLYPKLSTIQERDSEAEYCLVTVQPKYPIFGIYPAVYPYFDIYPVRVGLIKPNEIPMPASEGEGLQNTPSYTSSPSVSRTGRARSSTVTHIYLIPTLGVVIPPTPCTASDNQMSSSFITLSPPAMKHERRPPPRSYGLPSSSAETRKASAARPMSMSTPRVNTAASANPKLTSAATVPAPSPEAIHKRASMTLPQRPTTRSTLDRSHSLSSRPPPVPRKPEHLVLHKRVSGGLSSTKSRLDLQTLDEFPMPPMSPTIASH